MIVAAQRCLLIATHLTLACWLLVPERNRSLLTLATYDLHAEARVTGDVQWRQDAGWASRH
jgi:hypothetical protein